VILLLLFSHAYFRSNPEFEIDATSREYALLHPRCVCICAFLAVAAFVASGRCVTAL
jgi:hypothetical protein